MVLTMGRITNDIPVSAAAMCGRMVPVHAEAVLAAIIMIIEGSMRTP
jgi:hypothetical protein